MDDFTEQQMNIPVVIKEEPIDQIDEEQLCTIEMEKQQMNIPVVVKKEPIDEIDEEQLGTIEMEKQQMNIPVVIKEEPIDEIDEEKLCTIEMIKIRERVIDLEWIVVPAQDRIIKHTTQILNSWDQYKRRNNGSSSYPFSPEHLQHIRHLLIAALKRTDAIREVQRLHVEGAFLPVENIWKRFTDLTAYGDGKTLVIQSLRIPILSSVNSGENDNKNKQQDDGLENLTRWPGGYRYFICTFRAGSTLYRPPMTAASRPADAVEESALRTSNEGATTSRDQDETNYGYVEFITEKREMNSGSQIHTGLTESDGAPIMIHGLDDRGWKITVDLYGVSQTGENDYYSGGYNVEEHGVHGNGSVLDKSAFTPPSLPTARTYMITSSGPMSLHNTVIQQLGYFDFSAGQVGLEQFTLNKVHQSACVPSNSRVTTNAVAEETVFIRMCFLK